MIKKFITKQKLLFGLFCLSLISSLLIVAPLSRIPEKFEYGSELGKFVYDISIGYIISYIFYYLVVFLKNERDRQNVNYRASLQTSFIVIEGYNLYVDTMRYYNKTKTLFPPNFVDVHKACLNIDPFESPLITTGINSVSLSWKVYLQSFRQRNLEFVSKVISLPYIDSELFGLLIKFEDCKLFFEAERRIFTSHKTDTFYDGTFMEDGLKQYFDLISDLEKFKQINFKEFQQHLKLIDVRKNSYSDIFK
jgi:hypothetical protein